MTIEEVIIRIEELNNHPFYGEYEVMEELYRMEGFKEGYESKESELKCALIIPEGWNLLAIECLTMGYLCTIQRDGYNLTNQDEVSAVKPTIIEALRSALEQIENTKN